MGLTQQQGNSFRLSNKNRKCEAKIYLHPLNQNYASHLCFNEPMLRTVLKDPFWVNFNLNFEVQNWRRNYLNTLPKYTLLICQTDKYSTCHNEFHKRIWITSALFRADTVRISETILILETINQTRDLYLHCPYCNPCNLFKLLYISRNEVPSNIESLDQSIAKLTQKTPNSIDVET